MSSLTPKQERFVAEYLVDLNASQAAARAGYNPGSGGRLKATPVVQQAISLGMQARAQRTGVTQDRVVRELAALAFSDMRDFVSWGPAGVSLKSSDQLGPDAAPCVAEVWQSGREGERIKFKLHDKKGVLQLLGRHLGMFDERLKLDGDLDSRTTEEILRMLFTRLGRARVEALVEEFLGGEVAS